MAVFGTKIILTDTFTRILREKGTVGKMNRSELVFESEYTIILGSRNGMILTASLQHSSRH